MKLSITIATVVWLLLLAVGSSWSWWPLFVVWGLHVLAALVWWISIAGWPKDAYDGEQLGMVLGGSFVPGVNTALAIYILQNS